MGHGLGARQRMVLRFIFSAGRVSRPYLRGGMYGWRRSKRGHPLRDRPGRWEVAAANDFNLDRTLRSLCRRSLVRREPAVDEFTGRYRDVFEVTDSGRAIAAALEGQSAASTPAVTAHDAGTTEQKTLCTPSESSGEDDC